MELRCEHFNKKCIDQVSQMPRQHMCLAENILGTEVSMFEKPGNF